MDLVEIVKDLFVATVLTTISPRSTLLINSSES